MSEHIETLKRMLEIDEAIRDRGDEVEFAGSLAEQRLDALTAAIEGLQAKSLDQEVNAACRDLPEGWQVLIDLERGCGDVQLWNDNGDEVCDFGACSDDSLAERVSLAVNHAAALQALSATPPDSENQNDS